MLGVEYLKSWRSNYWTKHVPEKAGCFCMQQLEAALENNFLLDFLVLRLRKTMSISDYQVLS